jgi:hypothetical protein
MNKKIQPFVIMIGEDGIVFLVAVIVVGVVIALCTFSVYTATLTKIKPSYGECADGEICLRVPDGYIAPESRNCDVIRLGVVVMTKKPLGFQTWLAHHRKNGVEHFFVRVENTPELCAALKDAPDVTFEESVGRQSYGSQMERQTRHVIESIRASRTRGLTHLLHIDDDELLFCPNGMDWFYSHLCATRASCLRLNNMEAVYDSSNCVDPFRTTTRFRKRPWEFGAYTNGKSIGNLADPELSTEGPHTFTGSTTDLDSHVAVVLHYESACIERWRSKFEAYARDGGVEACQEQAIPFAFFCASIDALQQHHPENATNVWCRWKLTENAQSLEILHPLV